MNVPLEKPTGEPSPCKFLYGPAATHVVVVETGSWRNTRPQTDFAVCVRCGICVEYCPTAAITLFKGQAECLVFGWEVCKGCGICAQVCPKGCILMVDEVSAAGGENG
jgi:pyruvate ferredoxin oxidoreductase delta subunit